jgi:predicted O-linked N-acetylglucosamine transferase (SPINDLY family)
VTDAIAGYRHALTLRPDHVEAMSNLGATLTRAGDLDAAIDVLRRAIDLAPELTEAHNNLGNALKDVGDLDGAIAAWQQALALRPDDAAVHSNLVYTVLYHPDADGDLHRAVAADWAARHANPLTRAVAPHAAARRGDGRIKVGYVAPDFRDHCQSFFTLPLLSNHDRDRFEIVCYADVAVPDAVTHRLQGCVEGWRETAGLSDAELADRIRADGVDVLVDLTVHMAHHRLLTFARRPAPVQVTWLGYPGTTGLEAIDYRLSDPHLDPPDHDRFYAERTLRLPDTFWCYDPLTDGPDVNDLPANATGHVTFGCLNNFCKVTDPTLDLWARAMTAVPGSRLLLLAPEGSARRRVTGHLARHGITPDRLDFVGRRSRHAYLQAYQRIDIGLDTFPYNGHTTTLDACWMGVPVVTKVGASAVARAGWSQLSNLNLRHLAAHTDDGFVATAVALAADLPRLSTLRRSLRPRLALSPLCDGPRFARHVESAYTAMVAAAGVRQMLQNATVSHTENAPLDSDKQPLEKRLGEATGVRLG